MVTSSQPAPTSRARPPNAARAIGLPTTPACLVRVLKGASCGEDPGLACQRCAAVGRSRKPCIVPEHPSVALKPAGEVDGCSRCDLDASHCEQCSTFYTSQTTGTFYNGTHCVDCLQSSCRTCTADGRSCLECLTGILPDANGTCPTGPDRNCRMYEIDGTCSFW